MAGRDKEDTRGWSVVLKMLDQPADEPSVSDQPEHPTLRGGEKVAPKPGEPAQPREKAPERSRPAREPEPRASAPRPPTTREPAAREPQAREAPAPRRNDAERTVIDKRMASVLSQRPVIEDLDQSIETDGRMLFEGLPRELREGKAPVSIEFGDATSLDRQETTQVGEAPKLRAYSEPLRPLAGEDTIDDQLLTLTPQDRGSNVAPRPISSGPGPADGRPPTRGGPEPRQVRITPSDPKRASGEVRVTGAPVTVAARARV